MKAMNRILIDGLDSIFGGKIYEKEDVTEGVFEVFVTDCNITKDNLNYNTVYKITSGEDSVEAYLCQFSAEIKGDDKVFSLGFISIDLINSYRQVM